MHTPWGSAAWAAAPSTKDLFSPSTAYDEPPSNGDPIVIYLCGRKKWTHSLRLETAGAGMEGPLQRGAKVLMSERHADSGTPPLVMTLQRPKDEAPQWDASLFSSQQPAASSSSRGDLSAALNATVDVSPSAEDSTILLRRLIGTGPWRLGGSHGTVYLLSHGMAHIESPAGGGSAGRWTTTSDSDGNYVLLQYSSNNILREALSRASS